MKKRIILVIIILGIIFLYFKSKKNENGNDYAYTLHKDIPVKYKLLVFDNSLRNKHGMALIDSIKLDSSYIKKIRNKEWVHFKNTSKETHKDEIFEVVYNPNTNIILDYYKIGRDSVFRIQSKIENGRYIRNLFAMLFIKESPNLLSFEETMDIALDKGLIKENDTLFYGYPIYNKDDEFIPEKRIDPFYGDVSN